MKKLLVFLGLLLVLGAGAGAYYMTRSAPEPQVATVAVSRGDIVDSVAATGTLEAVTTVQVGTQVSGTVQELHADFNSIVQRGQVIARLDPSLIETQIEQNRANVVRAEAEVERLRVALADARSKLQRARDLSERNLIPRTELETAEVNLRSTEAQIRSAEAGLTQARANLNQQEVNLQHTVIRAPIDGIVISRNVDVGQTVAASMQAPTLYVLAADLTKMQVNANIDEADVGRIRPRQRVRFRVDAYPNEEFWGDVEQVRLQPAVVQNVVTYATVISVPNPELKLKPGMTATVNIEIARRTAALRVPNAALRFRPTPDVFAALRQPVPEEPQRGPGGGTGQFARRPGGAARSNAGEAAAASGAPTASPTPNGGPAARPPNPPGQPRASAPAAAERPAGQSGNGVPAGMRRGASDGDPNLTPEERRRRFDERVAAMSPEEREQMRARFRGAAGPSEGTQAAAAVDRRSAPAAGSARPEARTIDSLFGPLPVVESWGRGWLYADGQLRPVRLRLGISDGTFTEILSDEIAEGTEMVTNVVTGLAPAQRPGVGGAGPAQNPLMGPQRGAGGGRGPR